MLGPATGGRSLGDRIEVHGEKGLILLEDY
jgi:hypothetical protein